MRTHLFRIAVFSFVLVFPSVGLPQVFTLTTIAGDPENPGSTDGTNSAARFYGATAVAADPSGSSVYIADGNSIRKATTFGTNWAVTTLAGVGNIFVPPGRDGTNDYARFRLPNGVAIDGGGNLYVADTDNHTIRKMTQAGTNWVTSTLAGLASTSGSTDGTNSYARFKKPYGVAVDQTGAAYVSDTLNSTIRKLVPSGTNWIVTTIAGQAGVSASVDGTNNNARFGAPAGLTVDGATNIYVVDAAFNTIRRLRPDGTNWIVTTIAGAANVTGSADGTNTAATFNSPSGVALDPSGNLFITDSGNSLIRKIKQFGTNWVTSTVAGLAGVSGSTDGTGTSARLASPAGITFDSSGRAFIADTLNPTIRLATVAPVVLISRLGHQVNVSWPAALSPYFLETGGSLASGALWRPITNGFSTSGDFNLFITNDSAGAAFFRMHKP